MGTIKLDKKKVELLSENVNPLIINLLETTIQSIYDAASPEIKPSIEEAFGEEKPESIQDRVKSFEDACHMFSEGIPYPEIYSASATAFNKLVIIARALNEWPYDVRNGDSIWFPFFIQEDNNNLEYAGVHSKSPNYDGILFYEDIPTSLCCKSKELAEYFGRQFIDIWEKYLLY